MLRVFSFNSALVVATLLAVTASEELARTLQVQDAAPNPSPLGSENDVLQEGTPAMSLPADGSVTEATSDVTSNSLDVSNPTVSPTERATHEPEPTAPPTTAPATPVPTSAPTTQAPTTSRTVSPTGKPTNAPSASPSNAPTAFSIDAVSALDWTVFPPDRSVVEDRCDELLQTLTASSLPWDMAQFWEPNSTEPLYYAVAEGDTNQTWQNFSPQDFGEWMRAQDYTPGMTMGGANVTDMLWKVTEAAPMTPWYVAGTVCSAKLSLTVGMPETHGTTHCQVTGVTSRSIFEWNEYGRLVRWTNLVDKATVLDAATAAGCVGSANASEGSLAVQVDTLDAKTACKVAFEQIFPAMGQSMGTLFSVVNLFEKNSSLSFPLGNPNATETKMKSGWTAFAFFMKNHNPWEDPGFVSIVSPIDVTGSVCSFDQSVAVSFLKHPDLCPPLEVSGSVLLEMGTVGSGSMLSFSKAPSIARLVSLFDNCTFWGGLENCTLAVKAAKGAKKGAKADKKADKIAAKEEKKAAKKATKEEKKAAKKATKEEAMSGSALATWMFNVSGSVGNGVFWATEIVLGILVTAWLVALLFNRVRHEQRRFGYDLVTGLEDASVEEKTPLTDEEAPKYSDETKGPYKD